MEKIKEALADLKNIVARDNEFRGYTLEYLVALLEQGIEELERPNDVV